MTQPNQTAPFDDGAIEAARRVIAPWVPESFLDTTTDAFIETLLLYQRIEAKQDISAELEWNSKMRELLPEISDDIRWLSEHSPYWKMRPRHHELIMKLRALMNTQEQKP